MVSFSLAKTIDRLTLYYLAMPPYGRIVDHEKREKAHQIDSGKEWDLRKLNGVSYSDTDSFANFSVATCAENSAIRPWALNLLDFFKC
mmetsp:Transcript_133953/g.231681  ORF Transcript_133953/g.231681 Transcript_133953/m.231681 type:complete len:88 (-) Transcript_133953:1594-1857(-)